MNLITFHTAYIVRARDPNNSTGKEVVYGNTIKKTNSWIFQFYHQKQYRLKVDDSKVLEYREYVSASRYICILTASDVIHISLQQREGPVRAQPPLEGVGRRYACTQGRTESSIRHTYKSLLSK